MRLVTILVLALGAALAAPALANAATCGPWWKTIPGSEIGASGFTAVSASSPTNVWAVGKARAGAFSPVARFDGTTWSLAPAPPRLTRDAVEALAANDVWAVGRDRRDGTPPSIDHFDGTSWSSHYVTRDDMPFDLAAISAADVWAVGSHFSGRPLIKHWDGTSWAEVPGIDLAGYAWLYAVAGVAADDVWAGGAAEDGMEPGQSTLVQHWDGKSWSRVPFPVERGEIRGLAVVASDDVWAVGRDHASLWTPHPEPLFAHWDGTSWERVPGPPGFLGHLEEVAAVSADDVWAVGGMVDPQGRLWQATLHWDGTSWQLIRVGAYNRYMDGVTALPDGTVFAAGGSLHQLCAIRVGDAAVSQAFVSGVPLGSAVAWHIDSAASQDHSVSDASGMGLFDSGLRAPGGSFTFAFNAAGSYTVIDTATGRKSTVKVSMTATPSSGTIAGGFALIWAAATAPTGYVYDVQVKRPGTTTYVDYLAGTTDPGATFKPDAGAGSYGFRARLRNTANGKSSGWSSTKTITAS